MRPDGRNAAFLILSTVFLAVFLLNTSRFSFRSAGVPDGTADAALRVDVESAIEPSAARGKLPVFPVDINSAGRKELMFLPGVGEKTARRIIEKREELGGFRTIDELLEVKGIGGARLEKMRGFVTINSKSRKAWGGG